MKRFAYACALMLLLNVAHAETMTEAFNSAKSLGKGRNASAAGKITSGNVKDKVPSYGQPASEANYFQQGNGNTQGFGLNKLSTCAAGTNESDPVKRQECEAVNFLAKNPEIRPRYTIGKNDPMILNHKDLSAGAEGALGNIGLGGSSTSCTTTDVEVPAEYEQNTCLSLREVSPEQCTMGRIVKTDADSNFQCKQTVNSYETVTCDRTLVATVKGGNCTGGDMPGSQNYVLLAKCLHGTLRGALAASINGVVYQARTPWPAWAQAILDPSVAASGVGKSYTALNGTVVTLGALRRSMIDGALFQYAGMCGQAGAPILMAEYGVRQQNCEPPTVTTSISNGCTSLEDRAK